MQMQRKQLAIAGMNGGLVVGAGLVVYSLLGLVHDRDQWRAQAQAPHPTTTVTASATAAPASAASSPPVPSGSPGFRPSVEPARNPSGSAVSPRPVTRPTPHPTATSPRPTPTPTKSSSCATAVVLTVRLPLGVLPCNAVIAGGS